MNKTPHLQLNQWEKSDRIMMEDFNADNAKLDAVVGAIPLTELTRVTASETADRIDVDVSGLNLADYQELIAYVSFPADMEATAVRLLVNGLTDGYDTTDGEHTLSHMGNASLHSDVGTAKLNVPVGRRLMLTNFSAVPTEEITALNFCGYNGTSPAALAAGTEIRLLGIRK